MSAVRSLRYEALGKFGEHSKSESSSRLCLKQLLHIFRALQTSCVLHISMNARWCMNQLLIVWEFGGGWWIFGRSDD